MIKSLTIMSLLATSVFAQSSGENPLIPSGISEQCETFLNQVNSDTSLTACTDSLISATSAYAPGGAGTSANYATVTTALDNLCSANAACPDSLIRGKLAEFYPACQRELTTEPNQGVLQIYDILYAIRPFSTALCSKGDDGKYCVTEGPESGSSLTARSRINRRQDTAITPDISAYRSSNLPFLFISPELDNSVLCTACTRNIMAAYITWESSIAYAPGLTQSGLLGGQPTLYSGIQDKCGANFLSGPVQAAGGLGDNGGVPFLRNAGQHTSPDMHGPFAAIAGMLSLVAAIM